jgi:hypothetical protein
VVDNPDGINQKYFSAVVDMLKLQTTAYVDKLFTLIKIHEIKSIEAKIVCNLFFGFLNQKEINFVL